MKLNYLIPNLTVKQAAELEAFLEHEEMPFEVNPAPGDVRVVVGAELSRPMIELPAPEITHRHKLSQAEVVEIYRRILGDERTGKRLKGEEYAAEYGIGATTVSRIARGDHPHLTGAIKAHVQADVEGAYRMVGAMVAAPETDPTRPGGQTCPTPGEVDGLTSIRSLVPAEPAAGAGSLLLEGDPLPPAETPVPDAWANANL